MKKFFFLLFTSVTFFVFAQQPSKDYLVLWEKVYEDELNLLPKSALEKVNKIHQQAKKENNEPQQIRCLIYKSKFALKLEENAQLKVVESFKTTIENTKNLASKALLRNMLAYIYWEYYQQNRWKIHNRTKTEEVQNNDFRTWDLDRLLGEIHQLYQQSLQKDEFLKSTAVADYAELMKAEKVETDITLYEFLASKALTFYKDDRSGLTKPQEPFVIDNKKYLTEIETVALKSTDSTSNKFQALKIYQSLIQFQKSKKELSDYFNTLFSAADYVLNKGVFDNENELKLSFLQSQTKTHTLSKSSVLLYFEIAKTLYKEKEYKESVKICKTLIEKFPNKAIIVEAKKLKSTIEKQNLRVQIQEYVPVSVKSMVLVEYRNLQQASFKLMKVNDEITKRLNEFTYNEKQQKKSFLDSLSKVKEWTVNLKNTGDYLNHQTEIVLPELVSGHYLLLGETKEGTYAYKEFQATNLVFLKKKNGVFQVVNRNNGSPVANAKVHLKTTNQPMV